jgi:tetratricopeptide (TPR) repeat protein
LILAVVAVGLYAHTLDVPFQWDGLNLILKNPFITNPTLIFEPSRAAGHEWYGTVLRRYVGYFTFWVNYRLHGADPAGYHVFNITVHLMNSLLVYWLVVLLFRTPGLKESQLAARSGMVAFWSALLFAAHPVQIEAVTYIFQRHASLVGLFWLLSVCSYLRWRTGGRWRWYALAVVSALLAMKTKENAFIIPLVIALAEFVFFVGGLRRRMLWLLPVMLTMLVVPLSLVGADRPAGEMLLGLGEQAALGVSVDEDEVGEYLLTQARVVATYLRLFVLPVSQNLLYDYPQYARFGLPVFSGLFVHVGMWAFAGWALLRGASRRPEWLLVAFGILWFYVSLLVESSVIPIPMMITEYRMQIPMVGLFAGGLTLMQIGLKGREKVLRTALIALLVALSLLTVHRNILWTGRISLWEDVVSKSPGNPKAHNILCSAYRDEGRLEEAEQMCMSALAIDPDYRPALHSLGLVYIQSGRISKAREMLLREQARDPGLAEAHYNQANVFIKQGRNDKAVEQYVEALRYDPDFKSARYNLATLLLKAGRLREAVEHYRAVLELEPGDLNAQVNIAIAYHMLGETDRSIKHLREATRIAPEDREAHFNLGLALSSKGLEAEAGRHFEIAERLGRANMGK